MRAPSAKGAVFIGQLRVKEEVTKIIYSYDI